MSGSELGLGLVGPPHATPNVRIENPAATAHARIGGLRSVSNIRHAFASQSFIAEVAQSLGRGHRDFLLDLPGADRLINPTSIGDTFNHGESPDRYPINPARLRKVIERVTMDAKWGRKMPAGQGLAWAWASQLTTAS